MSSFITVKRNILECRSDAIIEQSGGKNWSYGLLNVWYVESVTQTSLSDNTTGHATQPSLLPGTKQTPHLEREERFILISSIVIAVRIDLN